MIDRIKEYLRSPKGREHVEKAKTMARDPQNQRKLREMVDKWRARKTTHHG
ncbi:hypothetical protein [Sphaerisporangium krabiense]|uniref:Uncharacterized protein n=1 Tax=Sphaerisporangium krabiense TaxID=763782 RepID=A0A7W8ZAN3_9ACTN|nr:hypothetical protein [Sphaerisporangium krabiense]MBB5630511.1 hypothetical protein [Sphaerisporangium krabiense]